MSCTAQRSDLLNMELPEDIARVAREEGIDLDDAWLVTITDVNQEGQYEAIYLLAEQDRLITLGRPAHAGRTAVRVILAKDEIQAIRTRQGVGGGFVDVLVDDVYVDILAYSNARVDAIAKAVAKLQVWLENRKPTTGPEDDIDPRRCSTCGMPLQFKGDLCRKCIRSSTVFARVLKLMRPYAGRAALMMALVLVAVGLSLIPQQLVRLLIDRVLAPLQAGNEVLPSAQAIRILLWLVLSLLGTYIISAVVQMFSGRQASFVGTQITYDMRSRVFRHLSRLGVDYYDRYNIGQLMTRVVTDTDQMKGFVNQLTTGFLAQLITVVSVGAVLFAINWRLALITLLPAPFVVLSAIIFWKKIYPRYYRVWDANSKLSGVLNTILSGIRVVKAFSQEGRERNRFDRSGAYVRDSFRNVEYTVSSFNPFVGLLFQLGGVLVWYVGGRWVLNTTLTLGQLMAFLGYLWMFYTPLSSLTQLTNWLTQFLTASQRVFEVLDASPQIVESAESKPLAVTGGKIQFENTFFGYTRHEPVLKGITFDVAPGEHIGVVGKSGSGKTTLINLLARFYDADEGSVSVGGVDVRELSIADLRKHVGIVLQEPFLFRGTIRGNITYGRSDATPQDVLAATKAANAHDFIMRHPLGYDTYIGERGAGLSGGERQRVSIARALLYDPAILVLDEATSSVDTESEQLIQEAMERVAAGRTTISIAHRLSTLRNSDRIIALEGGRIAEMGKPEELMRQKGIYYRLVQVQMELAGTSGQATPTSPTEEGAPPKPKARQEESTVDQTRIRYLLPERCMIHTGSHGALHVTIANERIYGGVFAAYAFPVTSPDHFISLMHSVGDGTPWEIGVISDLEDFPGPQAALIRNALARRYFLHTISRVYHVGWKYGFVEMDVETDKGRTSFLMRWQQDRAVEYGQRGKILIDVNENRYLIADVDALPPKDRSDFARVIYW